MTTKQFIMYGGGGLALGVLAVMAHRKFFSMPAAPADAPPALNNIGAMYPPKEDFNYLLSKKQLTQNSRWK